MRNLSRFTLALLLIAAVALVGAPHQAQAAVATTCAGLAGSGTLTEGSPAITFVSFTAGDVISISFSLHSGTTKASAAMIVGAAFTPTPAGTPAPASWTYTVPSTGTYSVIWGVVIGSSDGTRQLDYTISCGLAGSAANQNPGPGPDMIAIPTGSAVGTFLVDTPLYYAPNLTAVTIFNVKAGQSLWVFGMSKDGTFYQVVLSGKKLWVPVGVIGPTAAAPWNGMWLPTTVVE